MTLNPLMSHLTKSDFKACVDCATRLHYRKAGYPSAKDEDDYLQFLADGGFMIEFMAKAQYPDGRDLAAVKNAVDAFAQTKALLEANENVTIFEAAANHDRFHARIDILVKSGKILRLIEVKSSSVKKNEEEANEDDDDEDDAHSEFLTKKQPVRVRARWLPYLQDVTFQVIALEKAFPQFKVEPYLAVIDKSQVTTEAETLGQFRLTKAAVGPGGKRPRPEVTYLGDPAALRTTKLIATIKVDEAVAALRSEVGTVAGQLAGLLTEQGATRAKPSLGEIYRKCRECEFRTEPVEGKPSGFEVCWGKLSVAPAHILDLHRVGQIKSKKCADPVPGLLAGGSASYLDLTEEQLGAKGGAWTIRRTMQWQGMKAGKEILVPTLRNQLTDHYQNPGYPLHFVDFEACNISLPFHAGLHPYERVAFQWSCHTVQADGSVTHGEWLNEKPGFPNFEFVRTLREQLGDTGTVYVWSNYEQGTLKKVLEQLNQAKERKLPGAHPDLANWIESLLGPPDDEGKRRASPRIRDLHDLTYDFYFHPRMAGRTSIKVVLPAVWETDEKLRQHACFAGYHKLDTDGKLLEPYETLTNLPLGQKEDVVREGTGAIRVYQDLLFDPAIQDRKNRMTLLKQYCELDTAAMLIIWTHWLGRYDIHPSKP